MAWRHLVIVAGLLVGSACGAIRTVPPEQKPATGPNPAGREVFLDACALVDEVEAATALGAPVVERRLLVDEHRHASSCDFRALETGTRPSIHLSLDAKTVKPEPVSSGNATVMKALERLEGVGAHAGYVPPLQEGAEALVIAVTPEGVSMYLSVSTAPGDPNLRDKTVAVARAAATRASQQFPGDRAALPAPTPPPVDLCGVVSVAEHIRLLGWAPRSREQPQGSVAEFAGKPGGGSWECQRTRGNPRGGLPDASFSIALTRDPLPESAWKVGKPIPQLGRSGRVVRGAGTPAGAPLATVFLPAAGGRRMELTLWDATSDIDRVERAAVELARLVVTRVGP